MRLGCAVAITVSALLAGSCFAETAPGEGFEVTSYALGMTPDIQNKTVAGVEAITLHGVVSGLRHLTFSGNALAIDSAKLDGAVVTVTHQG